MPALRSILVGDSAGPWAAAGFQVDESHGRARVVIGEIRIELVGPEDGRGIVAWGFDEFDSQNDIDGITTITAAPTDDPPPRHENLVDHIDHVVMFTPNLQRTIAALEHAGFEARRVRDVPGTVPLRQQVFFWAGPTIIELVGPAEPSGDGPATLWGLAVSCNDLDLAHDHLAGALTAPKPAVQPGRRIATLRTRDLDISTAIAFMSPHA